MASGEFECPFEDCDKSYTTEGWLDNHLADKHPEEDVPEPEPERKPRTSRSTPPPEEPCSNHPERESVWESDGVTANVVRYCQQCKERYT